MAVDPKRLLNKPARRYTLRESSMTFVAPRVTVLGRFRIIGVVVLGVALCGLLGWKAVIASGPLPKTAEYLQWLKMTADNVAIPPADPDETFKIYAVNVVHTAPFKKPFVGYGVYLGRGAVITAAHVLGRWPMFTNPRIFIGGQDLPVTVIKEGAPEDIDLALLSVDETRLPISLQLRRNPLCKGPLIVGRKVVVVTPQRADDAHIVSPQEIPSVFRKRFFSLIERPADSGSGVFDTTRMCFLGIISRKVIKIGGLNPIQRPGAEQYDYAGYFVSASKIASFVPPEFRF
jgi:Trypsin-like peptidase domain